MQSQDGDLAQLLRDDLGFGLVVVLQAPGQLLEDLRRGAPGGADEEDAVEAALVGGVAGGEAGLHVGVEVEARLLPAREPGLGRRPLRALADAGVVREGTVDLGPGQWLRGLLSCGDERVRVGIGATVDELGDPALHVETGPQHLRGLVRRGGVEVRDRGHRRSVLLGTWVRGWSASARMFPRYGS